MVRMHRFVRHPEQCWSNGALFEHHESHLLALTEDTSDTITLRARGPERKSLLSVIASELDVVNASFRGLEDKIAKWVPCVCSRCRTVKTPEFFDEKRLLQRKRDVKLTVECPSSYEQVSVLDLLDGVKLDDFPPWAKEIRQPPSSTSASPSTKPHPTPDSLVDQEAVASLGWLHLSDLHQGLAGQRWLWPNLRESLLEDLKKMHQVSGPWDVVFFTGDLTQQASKREFAALNETLARIWEELAKLGSHPILLTVPGNHDLVRPDSKSSTPKLLVRWDDQDVINDFWNNAAGEYRRLVKGCFRNYVGWERSHKLPRQATKRDGLLPGDFSATLEKSGLKLGVIGLNSAFLQLTNGNHEKKLALATRQFHEACGGDAADWTNRHDFCFLLTHHPPAWLHPSAQQDLRSEIASPGRFAVHLFGHMHESRAETHAMNTPQRPDWIQNAARVDRPEIERWWKPEKDGALDGVLVWCGQEEHRQTGDTYNVFAIRQNETNAIVGVSERFGLRGLRRVTLNTKVFIEPTGEKELGNGRKMQQFQIHAQHLEALPEPTRGKPKGPQNPPDGAPAGSEDVPF